MNGVMADPKPKQERVLYKYLSEEKCVTLKDIEATNEQWEKTNSSAKMNIDKTLASYSTDAPEVVVMVIGTSGAGKSATANTLLGQSVFGESSSAVSETSEPMEKSIDTGGVRLTVVDTPGSWETGLPTGLQKSVDCYIVVINLASPRFDRASLEELNSLKGSDGTPILSSGRFVVALTHADATLHNTSLPSYIEEISGDPLHTLITEQANGKVLALNNSPGTDYEKEQHRMALQNRVFLNSSNIGSSQSYVSLRLPWQLWEMLKSYLPSYGWVSPVTPDVYVDCEWPDHESGKGSCLSSTPQLSYDSDDKKLSDELGDAAMESEEDGRKEMTATSPTEASQGKRSGSGDGSRQRSSGQDVPRDLSSGDCHPEKRPTEEPATRPMERTDVSINMS